MPFHGRKFRAVVAATAIGDVTPAGKSDTLIGLQATNRTTGMAVNTVSAFVRNGGVDTYFAYRIPLPYGSAVPLVADKIVLEPGDQVYVETSGEAGGVDGVMSILRVDQ